MIDIEDIGSCLAQSKSFGLAPAPPRSLKEVVATGCCVGCGICESIVGSDLVRMELQTFNKDRLRPVFYGPIPKTLEERAMAACPGAVVHGVVPEAGAVDHPFVGPAISVRKGYASDPEVRFKAAAGGGLTSLACHLVESGRVKFVVHVKGSVWHSIKEHQGTKLSFTKAEILEGRGSRYGPVAPLKSINAVLDRNEPFAFMGKPCDVNALRNYARIEPRVNKLCACVMTISCGTYPDNDWAVRFVEKHGVAPQNAEKEIARWRWRGHGCPGKSPSVKLVDGREFHMDYVDQLHEMANMTFQWRCKTCPDFIGLEADIVVMDCWPKGSPEKWEEITPARAHEQDGWVLIISRTARGEEVVNSAVDTGYLSLKPGNSKEFTQEVIETQPHQVKRATGLLGRRLAHNQAGLPQPALDTPALHRMLRTALDPSCLYFSDQENNTVRPLDPSQAITDIKTLTAELKNEDGKALEAALESLAPEHYAYHALNFDGAVKRIKRGDAKEPVDVRGRPSL
eukprot:gnl/MRDRNA2_/MRDRNA2_84848_c0_seq2.p1 gnl/MRDRNA2_/MRDRNA2_84848_c0~~gnl/MRDRNA2_/MRDRNA2_84848_c0_seq2.p1  ORF type:complete len:512 (+),score=87.07 gnl/MRDRNA2_/MRDRNA2_84848_c0_seq2:97-1632(+)